jgi:hypothetical protein
MAGDWLIPKEQYDVVPTYYVYGGLVFCPLTLNYLKSWGNNWYDAAPEELVAMLGFNYLTDERDEVVMLLKVLAADANQGYQDFNNWIIEEVNGQKIRSLRELVRIVEQDSDSPFVVFSSTRGNQIALDRQRVRDSMPQILATYRIQADRSQDLTEHSTFNIEHRTSN